MTDRPPATCLLVELLNLSTSHRVDEFIFWRLDRHGFFSEYKQLSHTQNNKASFSSNSDPFEKYGDVTCYANLVLFPQLFYYFFTESSMRLIKIDVVFWWNAFVCKIHLFQFVDVERSPMKKLLCYNNQDIMQKSVLFLIHVTFHMDNIVYLCGIIIMPCCMATCYVSKARGFVIATNESFFDFKLSFISRILEIYNWFIHHINFVLSL